MKALKVLFSSCLVLFGCFQGFSQNNSEETYLQIKIRGGVEPTFRLDSSLYKVRDTILKISSGSHQIKVWAPKVSVIDTAILANAGDTIKCNFILRTSVAYMNYQYRLSQYKARRNQRFVASPIAIAAFTGLGLVINSRYAQKQYDLALAARDKYSSVASQITLDQQKEDFAKYKKKYKTFKALEYSSYAVAAALTANYVRILMKQKKIAVPVWQEKSIFSRMNLFIYPDGENRSFNMGFVLTLK